MEQTEDLMKAIRSGSLTRVRAALEAGASVDMNDGQGVPGLPLGIACFMGHIAIVRELLERGAKTSLSDNPSASPLAMAIRGNHTEIVRLLIEFGAEVPADQQTGLSNQEIIAAQWKAHRSGRRSSPPANASGEIQEVEEIVMPRAFGIDTTVLDADTIRAALLMEEKRKKGLK